MSKTPIRSECPCCRARLEIDPVSGDVVAHQPPPQDLESALKAASRGGGQSSKDAFSDALEAEKERSKDLDDLFRKAADKQKKTDSEKPSDNPMDERWR